MSVTFFQPRLLVSLTIGHKTLYRMLKGRVMQMVIAKRELEAFCVVVPSGGGWSETNSCPICKIIKSEFPEDNEDWVWKNAVMKDGHVSIYMSIEGCAGYWRKPFINKCSTLLATLKPWLWQIVWLQGWGDVASENCSGTSNMQSTPPKPVAIAFRKSASHSPSPQLRLTGRCETEAFTRSVLIS